MVWHGPGPLPPLTKYEVHEQSHAGLYIQTLAWAGIAEHRALSDSPVKYGMGMFTAEL